VASGLQGSEAGSGDLGMQLERACLVLSSPCHSVSTDEGGSQVASLLVCVSVPLCKVGDDECRYAPNVAVPHVQSVCMIPCRAPLNT
jgi:hypothetical protein